jgi:hypothetical protein
LAENGAGRQHLPLKFLIALNYPMVCGLALVSTSTTGLYFNSSPLFLGSDQKQIENIYLAESSYKNKKKKLNRLFSTKGIHGLFLYSCTDNAVQGRTIHGST